MKIHWRRRTAVFAFCGVMLFSACKTKPVEPEAPPLAPVISSPVMRIESRNTTMLEWFVSFNIENPNNFELPAPKVTFTYKINERAFLRNTFEVRKLPASSVTPVVFGIVVYYADVFRVFPNLRNAGSLPSQLDLSFDFSIPAYSSQDFIIHLPADLVLP
jgi:hypothetical protein